jgi:hypothetical protein
MLVELPDGLAQLTPGPELSAILAGIDPRMLHGAQLIELLAARGRQAAYEDGQLLLAARELAYSSRHITEGMPVRDLKKDPYTNTELAFAMGWSDYRAEAFVGTALAAVDRTPAVLDAMLAGRLDLAKAKVIDSELVDTTDEYARRIVAAILPTVEEYTTSQLRVRIRVLLMKLDPEAARKRHDKALKSRSVEHSEFANGTAMICGMYLPKDVAAAAWSNIDAIAHATSTAGYTYGRTLDEMRADIFGDLLTGTPSTSTHPATGSNPTEASSTNNEPTAPAHAAPNGACPTDVNPTSTSDNGANPGNTTSASTATTNATGSAGTSPTDDDRTATTNTSTDSTAPTGGSDTDDERVVVVRLPQRRPRHDPRLRTRPRRHRPTGCPSDGRSRPMAVHRPRPQRRHHRRRTTTRQTRPIRLRPLPAHRHTTRLRQRTGQDLPGTGVSTTGPAVRPGPYSGLGLQPRDNHR